MKKNIGAMLGAASLFLSVPPAFAAPLTAADQPAYPVELAEAKAIIEIMFPTAQRQEMMDKMIAAVVTPLRQSFPKSLASDPGLKAIVDGYINTSLRQQQPIMQKHMPAMFEAMAIAYTHEFSLAELKEVRSFAQTKTGSHYLSRSSAILGDPAVMKMNAEIFADSQAVSNASLPVFKEKITAYLLTHPELATKLASETKDK